jgi:hypothetical protein
MPDECEPAEDCNGNGDADICDLAAGTSVDCNRNGVPDECETSVCMESLTPLAAPLGARNRYLSIVPQGDCQSQAIRVTFVDLPPPYDIWNGRRLWATEPVEISEQPGLAAGDPRTPPTSYFAALTCDGPDYRDWISLGVVHIHHEGIVPGGQYAVEVTHVACTPDVFSPPLALTNPRWGDIAGPYQPAIQAWAGPDGSVDIVVDAIADLDKFGSRPGAPDKSRSDVEPRKVDFKINITDVSRILDAFRGLPYPFTPVAADPCDAS